MGRVTPPTENIIIMTERKIILGIGNLLNRDEGVGIHAVRALQQKNAVGDFEIVDGGTLGLNLLPLVEEATHLIVLDAIDARQAAGTLIELGRDQVPLFSSIKMSQHQLSFQEVLGLAQMRGHLPAYLTLLGIQPADLQVGVELSPIVAQALAQLISRTEVIVRGWNSQPDAS
jgi:hydrogenase maturation protease